MDLEFEITNQVLKRIDNQEVCNKDYNNYSCNFFFEETNDDVDKFIIFKDGWNNTITIHLDETQSCPVPNKMLMGSFFKVYVYIGELKTNAVSIPLNYLTFPKHSCDETDVDDSYEYDNHNEIIDDCPKLHHYDCDDADKCVTNEVDAFIEIFNTLDTLFDRVEYNDKEIFFYNKDNLIETISLPFLTFAEIRQLIQNYVAEDLLTNLPNATSNQHGLLSASDKEKLDNLSNVALTGNYTDLMNIPSEFNPSHHHHIVEDVTDYEDTFNHDLNLILDLLSDEIRKN